MNDTNQQMLVIQSLDPSASVAFSQYTGKWYVSARIEISDGVILTGITEHCDSTWEAVAAYMEALTTLDLGHFLVTKHYGKWRREWRWNGAAFTECTRSEVL